MSPKVSDEYKEQKKKALLDSAMTCFAEKGYHAATVDDIVTHSGMSKGAVYNYFKSKEEIYLTLLEKATEADLVTLKKSMAEAKSASEKMKQLFQLKKGMPYKSEPTRKWAAVQLEFWINASRYPELKEKMLERLQMYRTLLIDIIREGQDNGEFRRNINAEHFSEMFFAFEDGVFINLLIEEDDYPFKEVLELYEQLALSKLLTKE
ncbi:TetR/AcrR family transcriptional regulator [Pullulanibacillus sp. KACC 23026]|uniref:TetR/AcrR family transcriptional regulator n=1 Tax=Pullulanibacillus sp. KACC 23026 TaxID=3028315 RepID=UPI0023B01171|nr:TetR/AcrR family transcriptional regulator [Pullulanibacillus sp. KACC 23026]WEG12951.1 TetR/AcrR family transcriptional regulator [Pullulanibacillus sp. KACC 23026]